MTVRTAEISILLLLCFMTGNALAQQLKPTEIIYSRLPADLTQPPAGANSPTIWAVGQDGANDRLITTGTAPRISDDGRFLLFKRFTRANFFNPFGGFADFYVRELATGQETLIKSFNFDQGSVGYHFSPESNQGSFEIIFDDSCVMYKMNRDGTNLSILYPTSVPAICYDDFPSVRRGGDQLIAFQNLVNDPNGGGLFTVELGGFGRQKIPNTSCGDFNPAWSNDNQFIAYGSLFEACGNGLPLTYPYFVSNIFKIKPDGSGKQQLTDLPNTNCRNANANCLTHGMVWTEDNTKIIAAGKINGVKSLFTINAAGGVIHQIPISAGTAPDFVGGIVPPRVERNVVSIGGGVSTTGNYTLVSTIGQPIAGQTSFGGNYAIASGFWAIPSSTRRSPFDLDGDGKTDLSIFRPNAAGGSQWWWLNSSNGGNGAVQFGTPSDSIVAADYTGDGKADVAFWRPSTGDWYILRSEDLTYFAFPFGASGDIPVPADFDGDNKADAAVFRPSSATWFINRSSGGTEIVAFGSSGDKPVVADYDGDGKADIAVYRTGGASGSEWWIRRSSTGVVFATQFGSAADKAVPGDYTGDGKADIACWVQSSGNWLVLRSEDLTYFAFPFGTSTDIPVPGDYDGDGKIDAAVFRPSNGTWYANRSGGGTLIQQFGSNGDVPLPSAFVR